MSEEQITDIQAGEQKENDQGEAPADAVQLDPQLQQQQQQVDKEVHEIYEGIYNKG
jgi:hypothetical protein